ncbi:MAG: ribosome biogenesis GTPase Der [Candidatus Marinimicrobia bacterium]|nr:ribosome biogenesis GTPase Der [Candidatus Neomarinimicrobiota bacterium]
MPLNKPVVAIIGKPNTGKSTLFNRFLQKQKSIVHDEEGVTRDRIYDTVSWAGSQFILIDTGGFIPDKDDEINNAVKTHIFYAIDEADLVIFLVDVTQELTSTEREFADYIRKLNKEAILVVNKSDNELREHEIFNYYNLGLGEPFPISALNGRRTGDLLDLIMEKLPREIPETFDEEELLKLAFVGRPNAGKSSLTNCLLGKEQAIVTDIPGTTRDSIDTKIKYYGEDIVLIDTAGLRKKAKVKDNVEFFSTVRSNRAISRANVCVLVIDSTLGFQNQDVTICNAILKERKGLIIVMNKWDLVEKDTNTMKEYTEEIILKDRQLQYYPILFTSAKNNRRVFDIISKAKEVHETFMAKISTKELNDVMLPIIQKTPPPANYGKYIQIKYVAQIRNNPPLFAFYCNHPKFLLEDYKRFLENQLRKHFQFIGVPIGISFRNK